MEPIAQGYLDAYMLKDAGAFQDGLNRIGGSGTASGTAFSGMGGAALGGAAGALFGGKQYALPAALFAGLAMAIADQFGFGLDDALRKLQEFLDGGGDTNKLDPALQAAAQEKAKTVDESTLEQIGVSDAAGENLPAGAEGIGGEKPLPGPGQGPDPYRDSMDLTQNENADMLGEGGAKPLPGPGQGPDPARDSMSLDEINNADMIAGSGEPPSPPGPGLSAAERARNGADALNQLPTQVAPTAAAVPPEADPGAMSYGSEDAPELADTGLMPGVEGGVEQPAGRAWDTSSEMESFSRDERAKRAANVAAAAQAKEQEAVATRRRAQDALRRSPEALAQKQRRLAATSGATVDTSEDGPSILDRIKNTGSNLAGTVSGVADTAVQAGKDAWKGTKDVAATGADKVVAGAGKVKDLATDSASELGQNISGGLESASGATKEHFSGQPDMSTPASKPAAKPAPAKPAPAKPAPKAAKGIGGTTGGMKFTPKKPTSADDLPDW